MRSHEYVAGARRTELRDVARRASFSAFKAIFGIFILVFSLFPLYWVVVVMLSPEQGTFLRDSFLFPDTVTWENFGLLFERVPFVALFRNSWIVASGTTAVALFVAVPAAYSFARFQFRGRQPLLLSVLMLYLVPPIILVVPLLILYNTYGLYNTHVGLIIANVALGVPFATWILVGFFASIPRELEDAALIDGCSRFGSMLRIALPLARPGIVAAGLIVFVITWNEFLFAFTLTSGPDVQTLQVAMRPFVRGEAGIFWGTIMSAVALTALPVVLLFLGFQRYLIGGLAGGVKG